MILPFQCTKCLNWATPVPMVDPDTGEPLVCLLCLDNRHAPNPKTGVIDCHEGTMQSTRSEMLIATAYYAIGKATEAARQGNHDLDKITERAKVDSILTTAAGLMTKADEAFAKVPEALTWAGVMELPGMKDRPNDERFKASNVIETLVQDNRRPPSDLRVLRRSEKICRELAQACLMEMAQAKAALGTLQDAASRWASPMTTITPTASSASSLPVTGSNSPVTVQEGKPRVACECGGTYEPVHGKFAHMRTKAHLEGLKKRVPVGSAA